jgi:hypothetical protein
VVVGDPKRRWTAEEIAEAWTLGPDEHALLFGKRDGPPRLHAQVLCPGGTLPGPR